jgi:predicted ATP-grasp superfamily ATP-dependent carboligase
MRRAVARDFAALDGGRARVVVTHDARLADDPGPWTSRRIGRDDGPSRIARLALDADFTLLIAPESTGILAELTRQLQQAGAPLLGSSTGAVAMSGDKTALAAHLSALGIETPRCTLIDLRDGLPPDVGYPAVLKPPDGAGSLDTYFVESPECLPLSAREMPLAILQPYVSGRPMSVSYLVDGDGRAWPLCIGEQDVVLDGCRIEYRGGKLPVHTPIDERPMRAAVESVPGLRGFVGVDFIWDERRRRATVLEINPRPTTSIVGIVHLLPPGRLASAWIGALEPGSPREDLADLAAALRPKSPISFTASGTISPAKAQR